jgi:hypothetical protein
MTQPASFIFHLRDDKVDELRIHVPPGEVLAAAGLAPGSQPTQGPPTLRS